MEEFINKKLCIKNFMGLLLFLILFLVLYVLILIVYIGVEVGWYVRLSIPPIPGDAVSTLKMCVMSSFIAGIVTFVAVIALTVFVLHWRLLLSTYHKWCNHHCWNGSYFRLQFSLACFILRTVHRIHPE